MKDKDVIKVNRLFKVLMCLYIFSAILSVTCIVGAVMGYGITAFNFIAANATILFDSVLLAFISGHIKVSTDK